MDWNLDSYFPAFDGPEHQQFNRDLSGALSGLHDRIEAQDRFEPATFAGWQAIVEGYEEAFSRVGHLASYLGCLAAVEAANEDYRREQARVALLEADLKKIEVSLVAAFGAARADHLDAFLKRDALADVAFPIGRWRERARRIMAVEEEALAADLEVDGLKAWSRLYDAVSGTLEFSYEEPGAGPTTVPMSRRRSLLGHPDRRVRAAVFEGGNTAWTSVTSVCAAALNAISGARLTLVHRRRHGDFLEPALIEHRIGRPALEALREALLDRAEISRGFLRLKAARMGVPAIAWYDLEAPTPGGSAAGAERLAWNESFARVRTALGRAYPALGAFIGEMGEKRWIEHTPRKGKVPGAFCTTSTVTGESRVFMTFDGAMGDVVTFAHEAGHAWHARLLRGTRPLARNYPMTLAESASTFAEIIFIDSVLDDPEVPDVLKRQVLDAQVRQAAGFLLDVPMRFEFERRFYEERADGEVSISRLGALMTEAQRALFGDCLAAGGEDPLFWASKLHFYIADVPFYNFPYTVGYLLSRALAARFKAEGAAFIPHYEAFLARSGSASCETLAREVLRADLAAPEFWAGAIDSLAGLGKRLEALLPAN